MKLDYIDDWLGLRLLCLLWLLFVLCWKMK